MGFASALICNEQEIEGTTGTPNETSANCGMCTMYNDDESITWECTPESDIENVDLTVKREFCATGEALLRNYSSQTAAENAVTEIKAGIAALKEFGIDMKYSVIESAIFEQEVYLCNTVDNCARFKNDVDTACNNLETWMYDEDMDTGYYKGSGAAYFSAGLAAVALAGVSTLI